VSDPVVELIVYADTVLSPMLAAYAQVPPGLTVMDTGTVPVAPLPPTDPVRWKNMNVLLLKSLKNRSFPSGKTIPLRSPAPMATPLLFLNRVLLGAFQAKAVG